MAVVQEHIDSGVVQGATQSRQAVASQQFDAIPVSFRDQLTNLVPVGVMVDGEQKYMSSTLPPAAEKIFSANWRRSCGLLTIPLIESVE
jgi:hypothetical protein